MEIIKRLLSYITVVKKEFMLGIFLLIMSTLGLQIAPLLIQYVIDNILTPVLQGQPLVWSELFLFAGLCLGLTVISNLIGYISTITLMGCANRIAEYLRNHAYDKMQTLPIAYFDDKPAGKIASRIVNNTETLRTNFYGTILTQFTLNGGVIVIIYVIIFIMSPIIGFVFLLLMPLFYLWQTIYQKRTMKYLANYYEAESDVNTQINEVMHGSTILQLFHQEKQTINRFTQTSEQMCEAQKSLIKVDSTISWSLVEVFKQIILLVFVAFIGYQYLGGTMGVSVGIIFTYVNYIERLFNGLGQIVRLFPGLQRSLATGKRIFELLDTPSETDSDMPLNISEGTVIFDHVTFGYNPDYPVLKDITFKANKGETIALVGHTGSGKSSIMNLLFRFYDPQKGAIYIDGQDTKQYNRESIRQDMGIVLQDPYLFTGTVKSNVSMNHSHITDDMVLDALEKVGAHDMLARLADGIEETVVEKGNAFSSGERQLIAFARTLASNPKILILDEATSHIDTETENIIQHAMNVVKQGRTTFIIAHRLSTIQSADCILVLHEGEIVERGNHTELLAQNGKYAEMYRMQQKI